MKRLQQLNFGSNGFLKGVLLHFLKHRFRRLEHCPIWFLGYSLPSTSLESAQMRGIRVAPGSGDSGKCDSLHAKAEGFFKYRSTMASAVR
jgi:hypothetical protein